MPTRISLRKLALSATIAFAVTLAPASPLLLPLTVQAAAVQQAVTVILDGQTLAFTVSPIKQNGVTLVQMGPLFQALGAQTTWEPKTQTLIVRKDYKTITFKVGAAKATVNGEAKELPVPAALSGQEVMVPLRWASEELHAEVSWDGERNAIVITSEDELYNQLYEEWEQKQAISLTTQEIVAMNDSKVVLIETDQGQGSGVIVGRNRVATNFHVMEGATEGTVTLHNGIEYKIKGVAAYDEDADVAIIQTERAWNIGAVTLGDYYGAAKGDRVVAIGSPLGMQNTVSEGVISNYMEGDSVSYFQISAPIDSGSSGGALFNKAGELIGLTTSGIERSRANLNFAVSAEAIQFLLWDLEESSPKVAFVPSSLPSTLKGASLDRIQEVAAKEFSQLWTIMGAIELTGWKASRDTAGTLQLEAEINPMFYNFYADSIARDLRLWAANTGLTLNELLPDDQIEISVYYTSTFTFEPKGFAAGEVTQLANGSWQVRYPVVFFQGKDNFHISTRY